MSYDYEGDGRVKCEDCGKKGAMWISCDSGERKLCSTCAEQRRVNQ